MKLSKFMRPALVFSAVAFFSAAASAQLKVGIDCFQHDVRRQVAQSKRLIDLRAAGEGVVVGDDRVLRQVVERQQLALEQRMIRLDHGHVMPLEARQRD